MSFSKIAKIALYVVVGISVLVIGLFYFGDNIIDLDAYEAKIEQMGEPDEGELGFDFQQDMAEADTTAAEADTAGVAETDTAVAEEADTVAAAEEEIEPVVDEVDATVEPEALNFMEKLVFYRTDIALIWAYILVIVTIIIALVFSIGFMFSNTKALIRGLLILVGAAILVGVSYSLASDEPLRIIGYEGTDNKDPQVLKLVGMGLITMYFVLGFILLTILYSEIAKYFK
ncbi:MAG: hypothetical protein ACOCZL_04175 [Bacteroidota bacterium]